MRSARSRRTRRGSRTTARSRLTRRAGGSGGPRRGRTCWVVQGREAGREGVLRGLEGGRLVVGRRASRDGCWSQTCRNSPFALLKDAADGRDLCPGCAGLAPAGAGGGRAIQPCERSPCVFGPRVREAGARRSCRLGLAGRAGWGSLSLLLVGADPGGMSGGGLGRQRRGLRTSAAGGARPALSSSSVAGRRRQQAGRRRCAWRRAARRTEPIARRTAGAS